jgi:hypothetical protein
VALPRQQHDVAGSGRVESRCDRLAAVRDEQQVVFPPPAGSLGAACDVVEDGAAVLTARVFVGHHDEASTLTGDASHLRAFGRVPFAGRPEDRDDPAAARRRARARRSSTVVSDAGLCAKSTTTPKG